MRLVALALTAIYGLACSPIKANSDDQLIDADVNGAADSAVVADAGDPDANNLPAGDLGGPCFGNDTCTGDLVCNAQDICVPATCTPSNIIFLNRDGGTYTGGTEDSRTNVSSIVQGVATVASLTMTDAMWNQLLNNTRDVFADFDVAVVDADPGNLPHVEIVLTNSLSSAVIPTQSGTLSLSPGMCSTDISRIGFIFLTTSPPPIAVSLLIAQNVALTVGLSYTNQCDDMMSYNYSCVSATFTDATLSCGQTDAMPCRCGGASSQRSLSALLGKLGASTCL